jgi:hypothetical protein
VPPRRYPRSSWSPARYLQAYLNASCSTCSPVAGSNFLPYVVSWVPYKSSRNPSFLSLLFMGSAATSFFACAPAQPPLSVRATSNQDILPYKGPQDEPSFQRILAAQPPPVLCPSSLRPCLLCTALDLPASRLASALQAVPAQRRLWPLRALPPAQHPAPLPSLQATATGDGAATQETP